MDFKLVSDYAPTGDQPEAIAQLLASIRHGSKHNTLLGVTGSGKTFTVANVISQLNRPTLVLSHNKTLAAQLYGEFKNFFPENAVEYFVSYYDYYQPEAYLPSTDTYIEKDLSINDEIEKMRLSTTATLLSGRRDVIVVSSVSCLYGCGNPSDFHSMAIHIEVGEILNYKQFLYKLVEAFYTRTERELTPATFRVTGDTIDIMAAFGEFGNQCFRVTFFDNEVESIQSIDPVTGQRIQTLDALTLYPVSLFVTTKERIHTAVQQIYLDLGKQIAFFEQAGRPAEAQRIKQRVEYDLEMIKELGYCPGIENYSRYFDGRAEGTRPFCLLDYFPQDYLMVIDESHVTLPQVHAMFGGDRARKENLVEYGFRLPAAKDNRPLRFEEFEQLVGTTIYVSATPADYELMKSEGVIVEQLIRPTGLVDPPLEVRITDNQIDDLLEEIDKRVRNDDKILVTTITKRMAEELSKYFDRVGVRNRYIHSDIDTLERVQILEDLRAGMFDVLIGVKKYMVEQGMCGENDYIWSDMWCGQTSGYGQGGNLLKLLGASYDINTGWAITTNYGLVYDADSDSFVDGSVSDKYKQAYTVLQKLVQNKVLDPETWTQDDDTALNKFYRGETAIMSTNRAQYAVQDAKVKEQLGEGNYELYRILTPIGTSDYQAENQRLECGIMISSNALKELGEDEFIKMMRFVDWLWYSDEGLTLTKWGKEGETYTVTDGTYSLTPGYYCKGLSIGQTSDDQIDLREELGYACGNFMYGGNTELLTSNFTDDLRDFYDRQGQYRKLRPLDPTVTFDEDQLEMLNLWGTPMTDTVNAWTCKFAMNQADINNDWDTYVAEVEAQNMQNIVDMYNDTYNASK